MSNKNPFNPMPGPVIPGHHHAGPGLPPIMPGPVIPGHHNLGPGGELRGKGLGQRCMPGSIRNGGCQPGLVCSASGDMGVPVCRDPMIPVSPSHHHKLGPGGLPPRHSIPTHYRGLGSKCNFMAGAGTKMGCMQGECLDKDGRVVGPGQSGTCMLPAHEQHRGDCIIGGQNNCGKGNYCKPFSSRGHRLGGRGMCTPMAPHPHIKPVPLGGKCNPSERLVCARPAHCVGADKPGASGTCRISGHPHQKPIPTHLALPDWDIGVGEADFGNISIANVGDIYLPIQNYMGQEYPGPQAPHMYRPGQDKNYHYK